MDLRIIDRQRKRIDYLFKFAPSSADDETLEVRSHWAKYICVIVSGYLESSVREIFSEYSKDKSAPAVSRYVSTQLGRFQSADAERIMALAAAFSLQWEKSLKEFVDEERKTAINSIVGNRHAIAHGDDSSITINNLVAWYKKANEVIDHLVALCR